MYSSGCYEELNSWRRHTCKQRLVAGGDHDKPVFLNRDLVRDARQLRDNRQRNDAALQQMSPPRLTIDKSYTHHHTARSDRHILSYERHSNHYNVQHR